MVKKNTNTKTKDVAETKPTPTPTPILKKVEIPRDYEIPVRSNVVGKLVYVTKDVNREWDNFGDIEYMTLAQLTTLRNTNRKYFENNWICVEDCDYTADEIYKALSVDKYYEVMKLYGSIEGIFNMPITQMKKVVPTLSKGLKENVVALIKEAYKNGDKRLDSRSAIKAFEEMFNIKLEG